MFSFRFRENDEEVGIAEENLAKVNKKKLLK